MFLNAVGDCIAHFPFLEIDVAKFKSKDVERELTISIAMIVCLIICRKLSAQKKIRNSKAYHALIDSILGYISNEVGCFL